MKIRRMPALAWIVGAFVAVIGLTLAVYLAKAGAAPFSANWPASYNLTSSDNSVLYQFAHDVFSGMTLDWSFSPQVYVFPEIPISLLAFALAGGSIYWYYVIVALINNALLFAVIWWLTRLLFGGSLPQQLTRAVIATSPLILFPLLATHWMFLFHLAPTYYFGMYLFGFMLPAALIAPQRWMRALVLLGWALASAVSPLVAAMSLPGVAIAFFVVYLRDGWRKMVGRQVMMIGIATAIFVLLRVFVFEQLAAVSPGSYLGWVAELPRLIQVYDNVNGGFQRGVDPVLAGLAYASTAFCLVLMVVLMRRLFTRKPEGIELERTQAAIYLTAFPLMGQLAMYIISAIDFYYSWPIYVGSVIIALLLLPEVLRIPVKVSTIVAGSLAVVIAAGAGVVAAQGNYNDNRYFGYRSELTQCLDKYVPGQIGYSTFSDARASSLTSNTGVELIGVNAQLGPSFWLANRAQSREHTGSFVLINPKTTEKPITAEAVTAKLGKPIAVYSCGDAEIWSYKK